MSEGTRKTIGIALAGAVVAAPLGATVVAGAVGASGDSQGATATVASAEPGTGDGGASTGAAGDAGAGAGGGTAGESEPSDYSGFADSVEVSIDGDYVRIEGDGIPDHEIGEFPSSANPNSVSAQDYDFLLPAEPELAEGPTETGGGPIGITLSGAAFYNPYNAQGLDAVVVESFDDCEGHPDQRGGYHYHQYSPCIADDGEGHSELWGYAFDGFPIYGPDDVDGEAPTDLDGCNGHSDPERGYHYHATAEAPYLIGCFSGEVAFDTAPPPAGGQPLSAGLAAGMIAVPLTLLGGAALLLRRRSRIEPIA